MASPPASPQHRIVAVASAPRLDMARALFRRYADDIGLDLGYQGFDAELAGLPGPYAPPGGGLYLALDGVGSPVGCVAFRPREAGICELKRLFVLPEGRGAGLARRLTITVLRTARRRGYRRIVLDTLSTMEAAIDLYRSLGFDDIAPYYDTPVSNTVFMGREL